MAYEIMYMFGKKLVGRKDYMALKLNMSKVYDRMEWEFLKLMMERMGFVKSCVDLVMRCLTSVSYLVILNGFKGEKFKPTTGL